MRPKHLAPEVRESRALSQILGGAGGSYCTGSSRAGSLLGIRVRSEPVHPRRQVLGAVLTIDARSVQPTVPQQSRESDHVARVVLEVEHRVGVISRRVLTGIWPTTRHPADQLCASTRMMVVEPECSRVDLAAQVGDDRLSHHHPGQPL